MPYRNAKTGAPEKVGTYVFSATGALTPGKTVASVTLPEPLVTGKYHVFALALG